MLNIDDRLIKEVGPKIKPNALSVLLAIAIHLNQKTNRCFPSHERLMSLTGLGRDAVYGALQVLRENKLLVSSQQIDSKNNTFGRRTFRLTTRFIKIFVDAEDVEPLPENPDTENPFTAHPDTENPETKQINNPEQINQLEQIKERGQNEKNSLSPADIATLEAEKEKKNPPVPPAPPYAGPTLVELHDAAHPDIPVFDIVPPAPVTQPPTNRIELGDRPNAETPVQLESALREFYMAWPNEWSVGILENGRGRKYDASKQVEIVKDFCCWAISQNRQRDTYRELNARLQAWFRNEQHSTWKQAKPGQPGNTEKPVYERPKNAIY